MRTRMKRILVAIKDPDNAPRAQLRKAATLARATGAVVEIFHAIGQPEIDVIGGAGDVLPSTAQLAESISSRALARLKKLSRTAIFEGLRVELTPSWDFPAHEAVIRRAISSGADLIVCGVQPHHFAGRFLLANTDWELIRYSPVPVLIVKSNGDYAKAPIVAAIDPFHAHAKPTRLDARICATAAAFAKTLKGTVHTFHAYMPLVAIAPGGTSMPAMMSPEIEEAHSEHVEKVFRSASERASVPPARRHLHMGITGDELAAVVKKIGAGIVVMGAVSRSGLRRAFIGNTAERVLDEIPCDVLVVKPAAFKTQVARRPTPRTPVYLSPF